MNKTKKFLIMTMLVFSVLALSASSSLATDSITYQETFEDDTVDSNPTGAWYTYSESGFDYQNVTDSTYYSTNQSFQMNETDGTGGCLFNFTSETTYELFELRFKIDNTSHNYTLVTVGSWIDPLSTSGAICYWNITDTYCTFHVLTSDTANYTTVWNQSIVNDTWYKLRAEFDYDTYAITGEIWSTSELESDSETCIYEFENLTQTFWAIPDGHGNDACFIYFDDLTLGEIYASTPDEIISEHGVGIYIVLLALSILVLFLIVFMFQSGSLDVNFIIMLLLMFILIGVTVGVLMGL